jgi:hypothetical protein
MNISVDPGFFDFPNPSGVMRKFEINDIVVVEAPTTTLKQYNDEIDQNFFFKQASGEIYGSGTDNTGVLNLQGGLVYEVLEEESKVELSPDGLRLVVPVKSAISKVITVLDTANRDVFSGGDSSFDGSDIYLSSDTIARVGDKVTARYTTVYAPNGKQLTLETFINLPSAPDPIYYNDGYDIVADYNLRINHEALVGYQLITVMCIPTVQLEADLFAITSPIDSIEAQIGSLPNIGDTVTCLQDALEEYRKDVSIETSATFQATAQACLNGLLTDVEDSYTNTMAAGVNQYETTATLTPELQFVDLSIEVKVQLLDSSQVLLSRNIPSNLADDIAQLLQGSVTVGEISSFEYDGYDSFVAEITSDKSGTGNLTIMFNGNTLSEILNRDDENVSTAIQIREFPYEFVGISSGASDTAKQRRDESDIAGSG